MAAGGAKLRGIGLLKLGMEQTCIDNFYKCNSSFLIAEYENQEVGCLGGNIPEMWNNMDSGDNQIICYINH